MPVEDFARWVDTARNAGPVLNAQTYAELVKPSEAVAPLTFSAVAPGLFNGVMSPGVPPGEPSRLSYSVSQRAEK